jgi:peptidoglycan hydrolase-like protein with peptidoglycan-binding domain
VLVRLLQRSLAGLRYAVPSDGRYGDGTARAVLAFRKVNGMPRTLVADRAVLLRALSGRGAFRPRFPGHGRHIEGDLSRQVLALIGAGGRLERVYTTSSGKPSTPTVRGSFRFYMKTPGSNAKGMYYSSYFIRGYAVHGYAEVPPYPASHGCLRVPIPDAVSIYDWIRVGDRIDVYA